MFPFRCVTMVRFSEVSGTSERIGSAISSTGRTPARERATPVSAEKDAVTAP